MDPADVFATWKANYYMYLDCLFLKENARGKGGWQTNYAQNKSIC